MPSATVPSLVVRFGVAVIVRFADDCTERAFTLEGEDEADPANGLVSFVALKP